MPSTAGGILAHLGAVERERAQRRANPQVEAKVAALKAYQQRRFARTYADLLQSVRYARASRFFLDELYGPADFTRRDAQFARVVPALVRLFPVEVVDTVATLAELHALSETLDTDMALHCACTNIGAAEYLQAWQATGRRDARSAQVTLTLEVARRLDQFTRRPLLRNSLRLMRAPARAAGLSELQNFLECGFDTFREMKGADEFMELVRQRELVLSSSLFAADAGDPQSATMNDALSRLP